MKSILAIIILTLIISCNKDEDQQQTPCKVYTLGYTTQSIIPDSVSIDSNIVIKMLWKRQNNCEFFDGFSTTYPNELRKIYLGVIQYNCGCTPDTTTYIWKEFIFNPDTVGNYPVELSCYGGGTCIDTVIVY